MTNYSKNPSHVRLDRFKPNGKWYDTFELDMGVTFDLGDREISLYNTTIPHYGIVLAMAKDNFLAKYTHYAEVINTDWIWVVLDPYHVASYPILLHTSSLSQIYEEAIQSARRNSAN